jgi:hypothetical protein
MPRRHGQKQAAAMYRKLPQLLLYRTFNLRRKTATITDLLGLNPGAADQLVRSDPRLMTYAPETLQQRAEALTQLLGLRDQGALRRLVLRWPSLLRKSTESVAGGRSLNFSMVVWLLFLGWVFAGLSCTALC